MERAIQGFSGIFEALEALLYSVGDVILRRLGLVLDGFVRAKPRNSVASTGSRRARNLIRGSGDRLIVGRVLLLQFEEDGCDSDRSPAGCARGSSAGPCVATGGDAPVARGCSNT